MATTEMLTRYNVTQAQLDACTRRTAANGEIWYEVKSQTTQDKAYQVRTNRGYLTCDCQAGMIGVGCWHKRAALCSSKLFLRSAQESAEKSPTFRAELAEATRAQAETTIAHLNTRLNEEEGFNLCKPAPITLRGYDIRIQRAGSTWMNEKAHGMAPVGQLPTEWAQTIADPTVECAVIFSSSQRNWAANKRRHLAEYTRPALVAAD